MAAWRRALESAMSYPPLRSATARSPVEGVREHAKRDEAGSPISDGLMAL